MSHDDPTVRLSTDPDDPGTLVEVKSRIVLFLDSPPGPVTARRLYDLYMARFGERITRYRSTAFGSIAQPWTPAARQRFEQQALPRLRQGLDWGYMLGNDDLAAAPVFLFHGARPATEPGRASLVRCDFGRDTDPAELLGFTQALLGAVECVCGTAGLVVAQGEADGAAAAAPALGYALAMRFWGAQAQDLDASLDCAASGFPCINWLTVVGPSLRPRAPGALAAVQQAAHAVLEVNGHLLVGAEPRPRLIDRHQREPLGRYPQVARALLPFQAPAHPAFAGPPWDEDSTHRYLHRFSDAPDA